MTKGRPSRTAVKYGWFSRMAASRSTPTSTSIPCACNAAIPLPDTFGNGSSTATTTRRRPAATTRSVHAPVRPAKQHGSSVQYSVAPRAASPASASAWTSACASPSRSCAPSPTTMPSAVTTQAPTTGFGAVRPRPRRACTSARRIQYASSRGTHVSAITAADPSAPGPLAPCPLRLAPCPLISPFVLEQRVHIVPRGKRNQVIDAFTHAHVPDRQLEVVRYGDGDAALRRAIELGQHDPGDARYRRELARLLHAVLPHRRI